MRCGSVDDVYEDIHLVILSQDVNKCGSLPSVIEVENLLPISGFNIRPLDEIPTEVIEVPMAAPGIVYIWHTKSQASNHYRSLCFHQDSLKQFLGCYVFHERLQSRLSGLLR